MDLEATKKLLHEFPQQEVATIRKTELRALVDEVERLDCARCIYCGWEHRGEESDERLRVHISECEVHPLRVAERERDEAREKIEKHYKPAVSDAVALAAARRDKIEAALAEIREQRKRSGIPQEGPTPPGLLAMALRLIEDALTGGRE